MSVARSLQLIKPVRLRAEVVHGFGRGSKQLGCPTANLRICWEESDPAKLSDEERSVLDFAQHHGTGIYCAFGSLDEAVGGESVYPVALSMGWNPTFSDVKAKTIEPWILHQFSEDFYGCHLRLLVLGFIRPELKFNSLEELKTEIFADGEFCRTALASPELADFQSDAFLRPWGTSSPMPSSPSNKLAAEPTSGSENCLAGVLCVGSKLHDAVGSLPLLEKGFTRLFLVRHGETQANELGLLSGGSSDSELNTKGAQQAEDLGRELSEILKELDFVGSSPQQRATASADAIARCFPSAQRVVLHDLHEMKYGELEGARIAEVRGEMTVISKRWNDGDTSVRVGGEHGESPEDVVDRVSKSLRNFLGDQQGRTVLLVCHSWVNKSLIAAVLPSVGVRNLSQVPQRNCAVNILDVSTEHDGCALSEQYRVLGIDLVAGNSDANSKI